MGKANKARLWNLVFLLLFIVLIKAKAKESVCTSASTSILTQINTSSLNLESMGKSETTVICKPWDRLKGTTYQENIKRMRVRQRCTKDSHTGHFQGGDNDKR